MRGGRRTVRLGVTVVLAAPVLGLVTLTTAPGVAGAKKASKVAPGTVTCTKVVGKIVFSPPLSLPGTKSDKMEVAHVRTVVSGCSTSAGKAPKRGIVTARVVTKSPTGDANACTSFQTPRPISEAIRWIHRPPIAPSRVSFSSDKVVTNGAGDVGFTLPGTGGTASVKGSYAGTDKGASSTATVYTNQTEAQIGTRCGTRTGVSKLKITSGSGTIG